MPLNNTSASTSTSTLHAYVKPRSDEGPVITSKRPQRAPKEPKASTSQEFQIKSETPEPQNTQTKNSSSSKKKKSGKVISLAEAAKGSIVYQKGKPCTCQARRHKLVSNCLSCGKIVCEQEGEGPCNFCGSLVLKEGSTYAGLDVGAEMLLTDSEVAAEAYAKRLVDYDRNSAARTTVIDDQSDYYEIENNTWLSKEVYILYLYLPSNLTPLKINFFDLGFNKYLNCAHSQEKELLLKKQAEIKEAEEAKRSKVVMTFDLLGRKVISLQ